MEGSIALAEGYRGFGDGPSWLARIDGGVWLVDDAEAPTRGLALADVPWRYEAGTLADAIAIDDVRLAVARGKGSETRTWIANARLGPPPSVSNEASDPLLAPRDEAAARFLAGWLGERETLLAWLETGSKIGVPSRHFATKTCAQWFALTDERAALIAFGPLGDVVETPLEEAALEAGSAIGRVAVQCGGEVWKSTLTNADAYRRLRTAPTLDAAARRRHVADALAHDDASRPRAAALLATLPGDPWCVLALDAVAGDDEGALPEATHGALTALAQRDGEEAAPAHDEPLPPPPDHAPADAAPLLAWARRWKVPRTRAERWLGALEEAGDHGWLTAALAAHVWAAGALDGELKGEAVEALGRYADVLAAAAYDDTARTLLEAALAILPDADGLDLVPREGGADHPHVWRAAVLTRLATLRGEDGALDAGTVEELAHLEPLTEVRLDALEPLLPPARAARVAALRASLAGEAFDASPAPPPKLAGALDTPLLDTVLRHPLGREGSAVARVQAFLAKVDRPDEGALRNYCEKLGSDDGPAQEALRAAALVLGMPCPDAYVSRGTRSVGIRSHGGARPFVLIGCDHLDPSSAHHLDAAALRFALGSELAHLRFDHVRASSKDVWDGALSKSKEAASLVLGLLPALKVFRFGGRIAAAAESLQSGALGSVLQTAGRFVGGKRPPEPDGGLDGATEGLIAVARVGQLTADRAGLVLAGDLTAAVRAIHLVSERYTPELGLARELGLRRALARTTPEGALVHPDLALRVSALAAFWIHADHDALASALHTA